MYTNTTRIFIFLLLFNCGQDKSKEIDEKKHSISVRNAHSMIYNSDESKVYLFGGANSKEVLSDLWYLDGVNWNMVILENSPLARTFASMVYDKNEKRIILFGGSKVLFGKETKIQNLLNDTWQFKNSKWTKLNTKNPPLPRAEASIVYDEHRKKIILFGGYTIQNGEYIKLGDTWEFYDNNWRLISDSGPSKRNGASMVYDTKNKYTVLFGGSTADKQYGKSKGETWIWKSKKWGKIKTEQPNGIFNTNMIYDKNKNQIFRFGGWNGDLRINETWSYINNKWSKLNLKTKPLPRNHSNMVYDEKQKKIILFGGHDGENVFGDLWEFSNNEWKNIFEYTPIKRQSNSH